MSIKALLPVCALAMLLIGSQPALAHHAFTAQYDAEARIEALLRHPTMR